MIPESAVWSPTAVMLTRRLPPLATVPATTLAPTPLDTVLDSPVIMDSSTSAEPSATMPSAGTRAPGRTRTISPTRNSESGTDSVSEPFMRSAVSGSRAASALSAPRAWEMARISNQWPSTMIVISEATSHQTSISKRPNVAATEVPKATMIARLMSVIMPGLRSASSPHAPRIKTRPP